MKDSYWNTHLQFVIASVNCNFAQYLCKEQNVWDCYAAFVLCCEHSTRFTELNVINLASVILCMLRILIKLVNYSVYSTECV